jgi:hypothetical protein
MALQNLPKLGFFCSNRNHLAALSKSRFRERGPLRPLQMTNFLSFPSQKAFSLTLNLVAAFPTFNILKLRKGLRLAFARHNYFHFVNEITRRICTAAWISDDLQTFSSYYRLVGENKLLRNNYLDIQF